MREGFKGFSPKVREAIKGGNKSSPVTKLGKLCIQLGVPVVDVAGALKVAPLTVYKWFYGTSTPRVENLQAIEKYAATLQHRSKAAAKKAAKGASRKRA